MSGVYTLETAYEFAKEVLEETHGAQGESAVPTIISVYQSGSRYVGFHTDESDYDFIMLCLPSKQMMFDGHKVSGSVSNTDEDTGVTLEIKFVDVRDYIK